MSPVRILLSVVVFTGCATERRSALEVPFLTCAVGELADHDGTWLGTITDLMAPPDAFEPALRGAEVRVFLRGTQLLVLTHRAEETPRVRDDGSLHVLVIGHELRLDEHTLRVSVDDADYFVRVPSSEVPVEFDFMPAIIERPEDWMAFGAQVPADLEMGVFSNMSTDRLVGITPDRFDTERYDTRHVFGELHGEEGHRAMVGLRFEAGVMCVSTPCGCSPERRAMGECRTPTEPVGDPPH